MKKLHLRNIIKEVLLEEKGYSRFSPGGTTDGLTKKTLDKILLRIANGDAEVSEDEDQVARGNKVLDRADPENVARILRGEEPVYNEEVDRMQELAGIQSEIRVNQPQLKKFNDYMHILDFFGGELPQSYKQAQAEALRSGYDLTLQEYTVADQNSTFSEIRVNNPNILKFEDTIEGETYNFEIKPEFGEGGDLEVILHDDVMEGPFIIVKHVNDIDENSFELYPEDIISIRNI